MYINYTRNARKYKALNAMRICPGTRPVTRQAKTAFNNDGRQDVLVVCGFQTTVWVFPCLGTGQFGAPITTQLPAVALVGFAEQIFHTAGVADFNGDGKLDLVIGLASPAANTASLNILSGNGDGTFELPSGNLLGSGLWPQSVVAADLDGDVWRWPGNEDDIWPRIRSPGRRARPGTDGRSADQGFLVVLGRRARPGSRPLIRSG